MSTPAEMRAEAAVLRLEATNLTTQAADLETPLAAVDLDHMTPEEIVAAKKAGRLDHLLNPNK